MIQSANWFLQVLSVPIDPENLKPVSTPNHIRAMLCLSVSIASNIGGTATTVGESSGGLAFRVLRNFAETIFRQKNAEVKNDGN